MNRKTSHAGSHQENLAQALGVMAAAALLTATTGALAQNEPTPGASEPHAYNWQLERTEGPCKSYSSAVAGKEYVAAKAVCDVPARIEVVGTILHDIAGFPSWMADCKETKVLKVEDDEKDTIVFWLHQHIPILRDRDMVLRSTVTVDYAKNLNLIEARSTEDIQYDSGKKLFRMPSFYAQYRLEWIDREHTRVTYLIDPDLGPGLPTGISNMNIRKIPLRSMQGMIKVAADKKYVEAAKTSKYARWVEEALKQGFLK
ncbi:exported protein of unknown function [Sterolibacterium denitrificans]|uniref:START domain-containing protein n=1 Tax=Sterolibacterium denitrificans TaxID=157592 RepID=A0A7Z7HRF0_9PROT|nr:START domain-containing protein [Sterolibacterium denitrificans]SMB27329.1 exported protein of unknown function [Sterolibacterium denitrificans]